MARADSKFIDEMRTTESFNASACMNCRVCTAVCPMGLDILPRQSFRYVVTGIGEKVQENQETIFSCLMCKMCEQNCPADVKIAENARTLRGHINRKVFELSRNQTMALPTGHVLGMLVDNLLKRKSVLRLSSRTATTWAQGLNLPRGGETVLYTGYWYQLIAAISVLAAKTAFFENSWITSFYGLGRFANRFANLAWFMVRADSQET